MGRGRKPTPSKIVDLKGGTSHTHRPPRTNEPKPPEKMPTCPKFLDDTAKKFWRQYGKMLHKIGLLTEIDGPTFATLCQSFSDWENNRISLNGKKPIYLDSKGAPRLHPNLKFSYEALGFFMKISQLFGMSPSARAGLKVAPPKPKSKAEAFKEKKRAGNGK